jgi:hypothetical protein
MTVSKIDTEDLDYFDVVSAIWILSCNDENPITTYAGVVARLGLSGENKVKAIIRSRRELFRPGVGQSRLVRWKDRLRQGEGLPGWLQEISDPALRAARINEITSDEVFRNQFRTSENAPRCDLSTIDWGLQHIERLRKASSDARNERRQRWTALVIPAGSLIIAALSLIGSLYVQIVTTRAQITSREYETTLKPKQDSYRVYMTSLFTAYQRAAEENVDSMYDSILRIEDAFFGLEPFLKPDVRDKLWSAEQKFEEFCRNTLDANVRSKGRNAVEASVGQFMEQRKFVRSLLYESLFPDIRSVAEH